MREGEIEEVRGYFGSEGIAYLEAADVFLEHIAALPIPARSQWEKRSITTRYGAWWGSASSTRLCSMHASRAEPPWLSSRGQTMPISSSP